VAATAGQTTGGEPGYPNHTAPLVFELTLSGAVDPEDSFGITHVCTDSLERPDCAFVEGGNTFCSGDEQLRQDWGYPECGAGTYTISYLREPGVTVEYELLRTAPGSETQGSLAGSVVVPEVGITIHLGYDYSLRPPSPPAVLPDTAVSAP
jgi:hypothetical protein